jgi:hypothetical protein
MSISRKLTKQITVQYKTMKMHWGSKGNCSVFYLRQCLINMLRKKNNLLKKRIVVTQTFTTSISALSETKKPKNFPQNI